MFVRKPHFRVFTVIMSAIHGVSHDRRHYKALVDGLWTIDAARHAIMEFSLCPGIGALAASHLLSFF
jgi:hypothetical protein